MKYFLFFLTLLIAACNTSSSEQAIIFDSAKQDGTVVADTAAVADTTVTNTLR